MVSFIFATPRQGQSFLDVWLSKAMERMTQLSVPQSVVGLVIDLAILVLPVTAVMQLQLPRRRKIGVVLIFMTGVLYESFHSDICPQS